MSYLLIEKIKKKGKVKIKKERGVPNENLRLDCPTTSNRAVEIIKIEFLRKSRSFCLNNEHK